MLKTESIMSKLAAFRGTYTPPSIVAWQRSFRRNYADEFPCSLKKERTAHPYKKIHPWKSRDSFTKHLLENVLYNEDGLVVLNKPYGISMSKRAVEQQKVARKLTHKIPNEVGYTISDSLPEIAQRLGYEQLIGVKCPERYMTGVTLLAANRDVENAVIRSTNHAKSIKEIPKTYWIVTTNPPAKSEGKAQLALQLSYNETTKEKKPVILKDWSRNSMKRGDVRILNVEYRVLSNSPHNLGSLIELKASTQKWHAIRLFAATELYSPVLGDNYHASRIQKLLDTYLIVDPFLPSTRLPPKLSNKLLSLLKLTSSGQEIIPVHIHLRSLYLPSLFKKKVDFKIEAPLPPPFVWACEQLQLELPASDENETEKRVRLVSA